MIDKKEDKPVKFLSFNQLRQIELDKLRELASKFTIIVKPNSKDYAFEIKNFDSI